MNKEKWVAAVSDKYGNKGLADRDGALSRFGDGGTEFDTKEEAISAVRAFLLNANDEEWEGRIENIWDENQKPIKIRL